jgi:hypothetical protein
MSFDPSQALCRFAFEDIAGVPRVAGPFHDIENFAGETFTNTPETIQRTNITRAEERSRGLVGKVPAAGTLTLDAVNVAQDWLWWALLLGGRTTAVDTPEVGANRHRIFVKTARDFPAQGTLYGWRDDSIAQRLLAAMCSQIQLTFAERALVGMVVTFVGGRGDYFDDPVRTAGAGTAFPALRGMHAAQFGTDATQNFHVEITAVTATLITFKRKVGDGDAMSVGTTIATRGEWTNFADEADIIQGNPGDRVQIYWPVAGTFAVGDILRFDRVRDVWVPSFPDALVVNEVFSTISFDGADFEMNDGTITFSKPTEARFGFGGRRSRRVRQRGLRDYAISLNREYLDTKIRRKLELGETFDLRVHLSTGVGIGTSGNLYQSAEIIAPLCDPSGPTATATDASTMNEAITATVHPSTDATYPNAITAEFVNEVADLVAAA